MLVKRKLYSSKKENKLDYRKTKVYFGANGGTKEIGELSDKQLKNIAAYDNLTEDEKRNIIINTSKIAIPLTIAGGISGASLSNNKKGAVIGAALGAGSSAGMAIFGHRLHKKQAKAAKKELEYRKKASFGIIRYDDPN